MSSSVYGGRGAPAGPTKRLHQHPAGDPARSPRGAAGVAVVVADHEEARVGQQPAELRVPPGHRAAEPHHQQQRVAGGVAEGLVAELDAARERRRAARGRRRRGPRARPATRGWTSGPSVGMHCYRRVYRRRRDPFGQVTFRCGSAYFGFEVATVTAWSRRWGRSSARPGSPGRRAARDRPRGQRGDRGRPVRPAQRPRPAAPPRHALRAARSRSPASSRWCWCPGFMAGDGTPRR